MPFSRDPGTGKVESYTDYGMYLGHVVTMGDMISNSIPKSVSDGGPGSGNFGHSGRPGLVGGSGKQGGSVEQTGSAENNSPKWPKTEKDNDSWARAVIDSRTDSFGVLTRYLFDELQVTIGRSGMNETENIMLSRLENKYGEYSNRAAREVLGYLNKKDAVTNGEKNKRRFYEEVQTCLKDGGTIGKLTEEQSKSIAELLGYLYGSNGQGMKLKDVGDFFEENFVTDGGASGPSAKERAAYLGLKAFALGTPDIHGKADEYAKVLRECLESEKRERELYAATMPNSGPISDTDRQKFMYPEKVAGVERNKSGDMTFEQADGKSANPNYKPVILPGEEKEINYKINCQTCVYAFEMRMRGYDVEASPRYSSGETWQSILARDQEKGWVDPETGYTPTAKQFFPDENSKAPLSEEGEFGAWLHSRMRPGERHFLSFCWKGRDRGAHIIVATMDDDYNVVLYDPQSGVVYRKYEEQKALYETILLHRSMGMGKWTPKLLRTDNLIPRPNFADKILVQRGGEQRE